MPKHHLIITGTGRAGTTFLIKLLTVLGCDTGYKDLESHVYPEARAGMEWDTSDPNAPYIIKSPWLCDSLDDWITETRAVIDHAIVPIRSLYAAAESRRFVTRMSGANPATPVPGGLWHTTNPRQQEAMLADRFYNLFHTLAKHDIPVTLLHFPRLATDVEYLYRHLQPAVGGLSFGSFADAFKQVVQPDQIHDFELG